MFVVVVVVSAADTAAYTLIVENVTNHGNRHRCTCLCVCVPVGTQTHIL